MTKPVYSYGNIINIIDNLNSFLLWSISSICKYC